MEQMNVAILGFGTVGRGAYEAIQSAAGVEVTRIFDRREFPELGDLVTGNIDVILEDSTIDLVAECMGGIHPSFEYVMTALQRGKHVVTPNKALISACYEELAKCAEENHVSIRFTPAAGGGIPWLYNLQRSRRCDTIEEVHGIVNGTCNYILDNMHRNGSAFEDVLSEAQSLGCAERDPSADIDGWDTQRKCVISANLAFDTDVKEEDVPVLGIRTITAADVELFNENGYTCKLLMNACLHDGTICAYVEPTLLTPAVLEASVSTNFNLITLTGKNVGTLSFYGQGAGKMPTGTSLVQDIIDIKDGIEFSAATDAVAVSSQVDNSLESHPYYFRIQAAETFPAELVDKAETRGAYQHIKTTTMPVAEAHALVQKFDGAFAAGYKE